MSAPKLLPDHLSHDTVECLTQLLEEAKAKRLVGIAFSAILRRDNFWVNTAGEARRRPELAHSTVGALHLKLGLKVIGITEDI